LAVVDLTKFLLLCGIPSSSISIITPYKGQKKLITNELIKAKCIEYTANRNFSITVSTVDRYQGDENDIVILSLVRAKTGNKFIALKNRFIVALSRARLGCYIIGSVGAVNGVHHWQHFIDYLNHQASEDYDDDDDDCSSIITFPRVGTMLPICCPRHNLDLDEVSQSHKDFPTMASWGSFCDSPCGFSLLRCGHRCGKPCHCPTFPHNTDCKQLVRRSCTYDNHNQIELYCCDVNIKVGQSLEEALEKLPCEITVMHQREN
jgi:hypothetical protein